jgi:hypothetical protein
VLPDFPEVKNHAMRVFLREVRNRIPDHEPILREIRHSRIHEGRSGLLTRQDLSTDEMRYERLGAELKLPREQMRRITVDQLLDHVSAMAAQLAEQQAQLMFSRISAAVDQVGNTVSSAEFGAKESFLEMQRRLQVDFDPDTLEPKNLVLVLPPGQIEKFDAQVKEWNKDPEFVAEIGRIHQQQIEAWRARENRRRLVD